MELSFNGGGPRSGTSVSGGAKAGVVPPTCAVVGATSRRWFLLASASTRAVPLDAPGSPPPEEVSSSGPPRTFLRFVAGRRRMGGLAAAAGLWSSFFLTALAPPPRRRPAPSESDRGVARRAWVATASSSFPPLRLPLPRAPPVRRPTAPVATAVTSLPEERRCGRAAAEAASTTAPLLRASPSAIYSATVPSSPALLAAAHRNFPSRPRPDTASVAPAGNLRREDSAAAAACGHASSVVFALILRLGLVAIVGSVAECRAGMLGVSTSPRQLSPWEASVSLECSVPPTAPRPP